MSNTAPVLTGLDDIAFEENAANAAPQLLFADATYSDDGAAEGVTITISGLLAEDTLSVALPAGNWSLTGGGGSPWVITFTAGLASVSQELVEAARVDGARVSQIVRYVLLPALRRPLIVVVVVSVIFALRVFDIVFVMTQGGPVQDTMVLALLLWQDAFAFLDTPSAGLAAAIAVLLSATLVLGAYPYLRELTRSGSRR